MGISGTRFLWLSAVAVVLLGACGSGADRPEVRYVASAVTSAPTGIAPAPLQSTVLDDGAVSLEEMRRALDAVVACVERRGFDAELDWFGGGEGYDMHVADPGGDHEAAAHALGECEVRYLSEVEAPFVARHGPSAAEIEAEHRAYRDCLLGKGYDLDGLDFAEIGAVVDMWDSIACYPDGATRSNSGMPSRA